MDKIIAIVFEQEGTPKFYSSWSGFALSEEDNEKIMEILDKYNLEGASDSSDNYIDVIDSLK